MDDRNPKLAAIQLLHSSSSYPTGEQEKLFIFTRSDQKKSELLIEESSKDTMFW